MTAKPVIRRERARRDLEEAADYYFAEGGEALELRFIGAIEHTLNLIADRPAIGSLRCAHVLQRSDLRCLPAKRFQYLVFYVEFPDRIDVLRILHGRRDIPAILQATSIDDDLLQSAKALCGVKEKTALVREGLKALIERESARRLARLGGSEPQLEPIPRRQSDPDA